MPINKPRRGPVRMYLLLVIYVGLKSSGTTPSGLLHLRIPSTSQTIAETKIIYRAEIGGRVGGQGNGNNDLLTPRIRNDKSVF